MKTIYEAKGYSKDQVRSRYVRLDMNGIFFFCEVGEDRRYDLRQGTVDENELPAKVIQDAKRIAGTFPSYVYWPI